MEEEPMGVPGHVGKSEWSRRLQEWLRDCGLSFEAEGEATRIMIDGVLIQVAEAEAGYSVIISVPLPSSGKDAQAEADSVARAIRLAGAIAGDESLSYDLDTSLPSYPMLYITVLFSDPWSLADAVVSALSGYCRGAQE